MKTNTSDKGRASTRPTYGVFRQGAALRDRRSDHQTRRTRRTDQFTRHDSRLVYGRTWIILKLIIQH